MRYSLLFVILISLAGIIYYYNTPQENTDIDTGKEQLTLYFFGSSTCGECHELKTEILSPLQSKHADSLKIHFYDIDSDTGLTKLLAFEKSYNLTQTSAQELFFPDTFLMGFDEIQLSAEEMITAHLADRSLWKKRELTAMSSEEQIEAIKEKVESYTFWGIVVLGLVDGINPCAIATMIFLISFLAAQKRSRRDILVIGISYTATVFVTYTFIGLVAFEFLTVLQQTSIVSGIIKWSAVLLAGGVGIVSFIDAYNFKKTNNTKSIKLQLPDVLKKQIHKVINGNLKQSNLVIGAVVTGFIVTILETFCTGQTYLPAIQGMVKTDGLRIEGWIRLLFYNFLFVLPLLFVMIAAYFGLTWNKLAKETQKHMVHLKVLLGVVMTLLAVYLALGK